MKNEYDTALQRQNQLQASFFASNQAAHGILIRLEALSQLSNGNFTVTAARFLLFLLFLVIECLPVTVKLLQRPGLYEEAMEHAREAERRDVSKFYRFRSRLTGPGGTAVLRPMLQVEPEYRIDAIWSPTRALPGSEVSEDDQPTEQVDELTAWVNSGAGYGPATAQAESDRPEQRWHGAERWRNRWQEQPAEDDESQAGATRLDLYDQADPADMRTRPDYGQAGAPPRAGDDWSGPGRADDQPYGDGAYGGRGVWDEIDRADVHDSQAQYDSGGQYESGGYRAWQLPRERPGP